MRRGIFGLVALLAGLLLSGSAEAQCNGCGINYTPPLAYANLLKTGANTLEIRNGGTAGVPVPQELSIYNFCDGVSCGTGYERLAIRWNTNALRFALEAAGTGTATRNWYFDYNNALFLGGSVYPGSNSAYGLGSSAFNWNEFHNSGRYGGGKTKALTDAGAAVSVIRVAHDYNYSGGRVLWNAASDDGTNFRSASGMIYFAGVNKAGTPTCVVGGVGTDITASSNANTLVCTWSAAASTTNCDLKVTCTDNTAGTQTMRIYWSLMEATDNGVTYP